MLNTSNTIYKKANCEGGGGRSSNFELLRILAMFLIVMHHFAVHGDYEEFASFWRVESVVRFFTIGGKLGVNLFVLLSGYFLINSKFKISKLLLLIAQTVFYSLLFYFVFVWSGEEEFKFYIFLQAALPVMHGEYWFISIYVVIYLLSPYLNIMIKQLDERMHLALLAILFIYATLIPEAAKVSYFSYVGWFLTLYVLGAYIRKYGDKYKFSNLWPIAFFLLSYVAMWAYLAFFEIVKFNLSNLLCVIATVSLFWLFKNLKIKNNSAINTIASSMFGIYLIHDNWRVREWLWIKFFKCPEQAMLNKHFLLFAIISCCFVFFVCMALELFRRYAVAKPLLRIFDRLQLKISAKKIHD